MPKKLSSGSKWRTVAELANSILARRKVTIAVFAQECGLGYQVAYRWLRVFGVRQPPEDVSARIRKWCEAWV